MTTNAERTLASEVRAVESGKHARLAGDGRTLLVKGEDHPDLTYRVRVTVVAGTVVFECDHAVQLGFADGPERMTVPCRHSSTAARRLEREGFLRWDGGVWTPTDKAPDAPEHSTEVIDRAHGARSNFEWFCSCGRSQAVATLNRDVAERDAAAHVKSFEPLSDDDLFDMLGGLS